MDRHYSMTNELIGLPGSQTQTYFLIIWHHLLYLYLCFRIAYFTCKNGDKLGFRVMDRESVRVSRVRVYDHLSSTKGPIC